MNVLRVMLVRTVKTPVFALDKQCKIHLHPIRAKRVEPKVRQLFPIFTERIVSDNFAQFYRGRYIKNKTAALSEACIHARKKGRDVFLRNVIETIVDTDRKIRAPAYDAHFARIR